MAGCDAQLLPGRVAVEQSHLAVHGHLETRSRVIGQGELGGKHGPVAGLAHDLERQRVDHGRCLPVGQFKLRPLGEEDRKLSTFRSQPEAILAAEHVDVRQDLLGRNQLAIDPAKTQARISSRGARHDAALPGRGQRHLPQRRCCRSARSARCTPSEMRCLRQNWRRERRDRKRQWKPETRVSTVMRLSFMAMRLWLYCGVKFRHWTVQGNGFSFLPSDVQHIARMRSGQSEQAGGRGGWRLEVGGWRLEVLEVGGWRLEVGGWRLEVGGWRLEAVCHCSTHTCRERMTRQPA